MWNCEVCYNNLYYHNNDYFRHHFYSRKNKPFYEKLKNTIIEYTLCDYLTKEMINDGVICNRCRNSILLFNFILFTPFYLMFGFIVYSIYNLF